MSRLSDAWAALCGRLSGPPVPIEPVVEVRYLPGEASFADVFVGKKFVFGAYGAHYATRYYATCAQAHAECDSDVSKVRAVRIDGKLYEFAETQRLVPVKLQPKPKRAKGAKA